MNRFRSGSGSSGLESHHRIKKGLGLGTVVRAARSEREAANPQALQKLVRAMNQLRFNQVRLLQIVREVELHLKRLNRTHMQDLGSRLEAGLRFELEGCRVSGSCNAAARPLR